MKYKDKELGCVFIRINPDAEDFDIFKEINKIHRHIKQSLIDKIWKRLNKLIKTKWRLIVRSVEKIHKILTQK